MTDPDTELARELCRKYRSELMRQNMQHDLMTLEAMLIQTICSVRQEENEACAKVASEYHYGKLGIVGVQEASEEIATSIRNRMKEKP